MTLFFERRLAAIVMLLWVGAMPSLAATSSASSASTSIATSVGSVSGSIQRSSDSSSKTNAVAEGDYTIDDIAELDERPGAVRMRLQARPEGIADREFFLWVPQQVVAKAGLARGGIVTVRHRAYGMEFMHGTLPQAFFLVLSDDWYRELQATAVVF